MLQCSSTCEHPKTPKASCSRSRISSRWRRRSCRTCCQTMTNRTKAYNSRSTSTQRTDHSSVTTNSTETLIEWVGTCLRRIQCYQAAPAMRQQTTTRMNILLRWRAVRKRAAVSVASTAIIIYWLPARTSKAATQSTKASFKDTAASTIVETPSMPWTTVLRCGERSIWWEPSPPSTHVSSQYASHASTTPTAVSRVRTLFFTILCMTLSVLRTRQLTILSPCLSPAATIRPRLMRLTESSTSGKIAIFPKAMPIITIAYQEPLPSHSKLAKKVRNSTRTSNSTCRTLFK